MRGSIGSSSTRATPRFHGSSAMLAETTPITGGTGDFLGATGLVTGKALSATENSFVITITK